MSASDWIGIGVVALVIVGGLLLLNQITKPYDVKNEEEFQRRRKEGAGLLNAAMLGLQVGGELRLEIAVRHVHRALDGFRDLAANGAQRFHLAARLREKHDEVEYINPQGPGARGAVAVAEPEVQRRSSAVRKDEQCRHLQPSRTCQRTLWPPLSDTPRAL